MSLVTVIISTYNSSAFVVETLESVLKQTWKEIELIITDDCSLDNTVEICRKWISDNSQRFIHTELLNSEVNTGISRNANRGLKAATGEWIKFLGSDDTLEPDCLNDNMQFLDRHSEIRVLFSKINIYLNTFEKKNIIETTPVGDISRGSIIWPERTAESQYRMLLLSDRIHFTPSVFIHRETILSVGGFDERFKFLEDYPLWLKITKKGYRLYFMDKVTVNYRRHSKAINNTGIPYLVNPNYFKSEDFRRIYTYPFLPADIRLFQRYNWYVLQLFRSDWLNRKNKLSKFLHDILIIYLNPLKYIIWLKTHLNKSLRNDEFYM
jgi:glycosyltransferase involved in cell wall biosynthesis